MAIFGKLKIDRNFVKNYSKWIMLTQAIATAIFISVLIHVMKQKNNTPPAPPPNITIIGEGEIANTPNVIGEGELNANQPTELRGVAMQVPTSSNTLQSLNSIVSEIRPAVIKVMVRPGNNINTSTNGQAPSGSGAISLGDPYQVGQNTAVGSGVLIDSQGHFLTTKHIVGRNKDLDVVLYRNGKNHFTARVISQDPNSILVLGKIRSNETFPFAKLGDSNLLRTGDIVLAVGNPFSLSGTVTSGIISGKKDMVIEGKNIANVIQTDATINDGNAGGPIVNTDAEVIGITFASYSINGAFTGIGFAVPINMAKDNWRKL